MNILWIALSFLTTIPAPQVPYIPRGLSRAAVWFPFVGLMIGALLATVGWALLFIFPATITALFITALWIMLTGGLHLDGVADCCDGLLAPVSVEKRLEILRDPRNGTFAVLGLILFVILKITAVYTLLQTNTFILPLLLAPTISRWLILPTAKQPLARSSGMGVEFAQGLTTKIIGTALLLPIILTALAGWQGVVAFVMAGLTTGWWIHLANKRIGGVTGDVYGAVVETTELAILLTFCLNLG